MENINIFSIDEQTGEMIDVTDHELLVRYQGNHVGHRKQRIELGFDHFERKGNHPYRRKLERAEDINGENYSESDN